MTRFKLYTLFTFVFIASHFYGAAQVAKPKASLLALAKTEMGQLRYAYAIPFLKKYIKEGKVDSASLSMLGQCYKMQNRFDSAIYFYQKLDSLIPVRSNDLAELYATVGDYDKAIKSYQNLITLQSDKSTALYSMYERRLQGFLTRSKFDRDSLDYKVRYLQINTPYNEFGAALLDSGFVFESNRSKKVTRNNEFGWDGLPFTKLYYQLSTKDLATDSIIYGNWKEKSVNKGISDKTPSLVNDNRSLQNQFDLQKLNGAPKVESPLFAPGFGGDYNFGSISFTADGMQAFFTKNQTNAKGIKQLEIWSTRRVNNGWNAPVKLYFNNPAHSYFHPAITPGGERLFFVSDQPGGIGGTDIYYVNRREDGSWDATVNAGAGINTAANELFPTFYESNLYFSSNGHEGLGGLDIYKFKSTGVENLGKPINSEKDDFAFTINENKNIGFVASNRNGNDDIFKLIPVCNYEVNAIVTNANSGAIIAEANVSILDDKNNIISTIKSNNKGEVSYTVDCEKTYTIQAIKDGFESNSFAVIASNKKGGSIKIDAVLMPISEIITEKEVNLKPIFFEYNNSNITQQGAFELDKLVQIMKNNEKLIIFVKSHTDNRGTDEFNLLLSDKRVKATIQYVISNGIDPNRISGKGFGETEPKVDCKENCTEEAHEQNRRSEFLIVK